MVEIDKIEFHDNLPSLFNHTRPRTAGRAARKGKGTAPEAGAHPKGRNEMEEPREARLAHRPSGPTAARRLPRCPWPAQWQRRRARSEEHTSELQSLMRSSYAVFCLKKKKGTHK